MVQTFSLEQQIIVTRLRAAIYVRVSTKKQDEEGYSLDSQVEHCLRWCQEHGYDVLEFHIYREVMTGVIYRERPQLSKLRTAARDREFDIVVIYDFDRLAREDTHQTVIIQDLKDNGVRVEAVKRNIEDTPAGRYLLHTYGFMAEVEREKILQRCEDGRQMRLAAGKLLGFGPPKYGYEWNKNRTAYFINPKEREVVEQIFTWAKEGYNIKRIVYKLKEMGVLTRTGKPVWSRSMVRAILADPCYMGNAIAYKTRSVHEPGKPTRQVVRPEDQQIHLPEGVIPAIVDEETYLIVQKQLERNKLNAQRNNQHPESALLRCGYALCGYCRTTMNAHWQEGSSYYRCKKGHNREGCQYVTISARKLDAAAWEHAIEIILDPALVAQKLEQWKKDAEPDNDLVYVNNELSRIAAEVKNIVELSAMSPNHMVLETASGLLNDLERQRIKFEKMRSPLLDIESQKKREADGLAAFEQRCATWRKKLKSKNAEFTFAEKREAIEYFGIKARVWRDEHSPRFTFSSKPPSIVSTEL